MDGCTVDTFINSAYLININEVDVPINVYCNAGCSIAKRGKFGSTIVWHNPKGIANIVPLKTIKLK